MNKKTRKLFTWCLVVALVVTQMLFANVAFAATSLKGTDRYQTALEVVKAGWTQNDNAVIARGDDLADALAAAPLAYAKGKAPILLTETATLPAGVMEELTALGVKNVYIVGGTGAVSQAVETALAAKFTVKRLSGADRAATALAVAKEAFPTAPAKAVMVNGYAVADALSISAIAAYNGMPILLVDKDTKAADVATYLTGKTVYAVGGEGVISAANLGTATRLSGADRYATNVAVLKAFTLDYNKVFVAVGEDANAVDALGGAAYAALGNNPIVLVNGALTTEASALLKLNVKFDTKVYTLGGVVPASVATAIEALMPKDLSIESVTIVNAKDIVVDFNLDMDALTAEVSGNYELKVNNGSALGTGNYTATLDTDDASKVNIELNDASALKNGDVLTLKVKKAVLSESLLAFAADKTVTLAAFSDTTAPKVAKVTVSGNDLVVDFDEYVTAIGLAKVNGLNATVPAIAADTKSITLTGAAAGLGNGNHTLVLANVVDNANPANTAVYLTAPFSITDDTVDPIVKSVEKVTEDSFKITFNKSVTKPTVTVKKAGLDLTVVSVSPAGPDDEYTVTVADNGGVKLYNTNETTVTLVANISAYKAVSNNTVGDAKSANVVLSKDSAAPTVVTRFTKIVDNGTALAPDEAFQIRFNEEIQNANAALIILKDGDGVRQTIDNATVVADADGNDTILEIEANAVRTATAGVIDADTYTFELAAGAVEDLATNDCAATTVTMTKAGSSVSDITPSISASGDTISIDYSEVMTSSAIDLANYKIDGAALPAKTSIYFVTDKENVEIKLPAGSIVSTADVLFTISGSVKSDAGAVVADANLNTVLTGLTDNVKPVLVSAKKVDSTHIDLTFSEAIDTVTDNASFRDDFVVTVNGMDLTVSAIANGSTSKVVRLTVASYNVNQTVVVKVADAPDSVDDAATNVVTAKTSVTATN